MTDHGLVRLLTLSKRLEDQVLRILWPTDRALTGTVMRNRIKKVIESPVNGGQQCQ